MLNIKANQANFIRNPMENLEENTQFFHAKQEKMRTKKKKTQENIKKEKVGKRWH